MKKNFMIAVLAFCLLAAPPAQAVNPVNDAATIIQGVTKTIGGVFSIPKAILEDSTRVLFPFGIITGTIRGAVQTVASTLVGALTVAKGAAPYAKYAALL